LKCRAQAFKSGNSQAAHILADMACERTDIDLEIVRESGEIRIRSARRLLSPTRRYCFITFTIFIELN
jgi:hypothetical protein